MDLIIDGDGFNPEDHSGVLNSQNSALLNLLFVLGYDSKNPPVARILQQLHHLDGQWAVVTPIYWQASHNDAVIVAAGHELRLGLDELKACYESYAQFLAEEGMALFYHDKEHWLLQAEGKPPFHSPPIYQLRNTSIVPALVALDSSHYWQKFITESQMFFSGQPYSADLNGVWLWGDGTQSITPKPITICAESKWFNLAQILSSKVSLYNPSARLTDYQIIIISNVEDLSELHQKELGLISVNWYWNNVAYRTKKLNMITRLWRKLTHAHQTT